ISNLNLPQWQALIGDTISEGDFTMNLAIASHEGGKKLDAAYKSHVAGLTAKLGGNGISEGTLDCNLNAEITELKHLAITNCEVTLTEQGQPALQILASGAFEGTTFTLQSEVEAVLSRLTGKGSTTPFKTGIALSGSFAKNIADINEILLSLPPTDRAAKNELRVKGQLDLSFPALTKGQFDLTADTLDLTPLYDAVATPSTNTATASTISAPPPEKTHPNIEPPPIKFPFQFTIGIDLKHAWLHEITMDDCQITAKAGGDKLILDPCTLTLDGGRANATAGVDLGVPGYKYSLDAALDQVALEPLANTFSPENIGRYKGSILSSVKINGAGVTGASLQKSLTGQVNFALTNADIQLTGPKFQKVVGPIANLLGLHELLTYPLTSVDLKIDMGAGNITISNCVAGSSSFEASIEGTIPIADVLSNSPLNLPVQILLSRTLAQNISLTPTNTPPDATFVPLKNFATIRGTLGNPSTLVDKQALGGVFVHSGVGIAKRLGGEASTGVKKAVSGFRNLFHSHDSTTNTPAPNASPQ
ncbi:MAG TPA: AsmA family protein, partial [Verrucomicrobiae bacterium]